MKIRHKKTIALLVIAVLLFLGASLALRSTGVSNFLKRELFTEFEKATNLQIMADKVIVNLFPLYIEAKGVKIMDQKGSLLTAGDVKAYVSLTGFLGRTILIKRLYFSDLKAWLDPERLEHISSLGKEKKEQRGGFKLKLYSVAVNSGAVDYSDGKGNEFSTGGLNGEAVLGRKKEFRLKADKLSLALAGKAPISAKIKKSSGSLKNDVFTLHKFQGEVEGSGINLTGGSYSKKAGLALKGGLDVSPATFKRYFKLQGPGEGNLSVKGSLKVPDPNNIKTASFDAHVKGDFHLETLLELVRAGTKISGQTHAEGTLKGKVMDFRASGKGLVTNADVYGLKVDRAAMDIVWADGILSLKNMNGSVYGGKAKGEVILPLPKVHNYRVKVDAAGADTRKFLTFLKLNLPVPEGKLSGGILSQGDKFSPSGTFLHETTVAGADFPGRIKTIAGTFSLKDGIVNLSSLQIKSALTQIVGSGVIDTVASTIDSKLGMGTNNIEDLSAPYYKDISGKGTFQGSLRGSLKDPVLAGRLDLRNAVHKGHMLGETSGTISYRKNLLAIKELNTRIENEAISLTGNISFPKATEVFQLKNPDFNLSAKMEKANLKDLVQLFEPGLPITGTISSRINIKGTEPVISGSADIENGAYSGYSVSSARMDLSYSDRTLQITNATLARGKSSLKGNASINSRKEFTLKASSDSLRLKDVITRPDFPLDYRMSLEAEGKGTVDNPKLTASGKLLEGSYRDQKLQPGEFKASLDGKKLKVSLDLARRLYVDGNTVLEGEFPWQIQLDLKGGRYDYLAGAFIANPPEDLLVNIAGKGAFNGTRKNLNGSFTFTQFTIAAYGQSFTAGKNARVAVNNKAVTLSNFSFGGGQTLVNISGGLVLGASYDLDIEGKSSLAPAKAFMKDLEMISGNASYVLHIGGPWKKPKISGGLSVSEANLGLKGVSQNLRLSSAYLYVDEDRLVLQEFAGKMGGGDVSMTGIVYLDGFKPRRFYLDSLINNVSTTFQGVVGTLTGNLILRGDTKGQSLLGELNIKRAVYKKPVDWRAIVFGKKAGPLVPTGFLSRTELKVRIYGSDNIRIANDLARAPLNIDLTIMGTGAEPVPVGRVETNKGKIFFRNTEFTIEQLSVIFADPNRINPVLNILATSVVKGYSIRVSISGTLDRFNLALSSEPQLDEVNILSLLTVGEFGQGVKGAEGGIGAAEATSFLTGQFQSVVSERLKTITGFDRFQVDPYVSKTTGTVTPRVTVSKRLLGEKLFVTYSSPVSTEEQEVIRLEYAVSPTVSLIGVRDERGSAGGDVRFRFEFK